MDVMEEVDIISSEAIAEQEKAEAEALVLHETPEAAAERHYLIAFEAWQRRQTRPETRWEFADRMAKQGGADGEA